MLEVIRDIPSTSDLGTRNYIIKKNKMYFEDWGAFGRSRFGRTTFRRSYIWPDHVLPVACSIDFPFTN
jgi:hypothetical protein